MKSRLLFALLVLGLGVATFLVIGLVDTYLPYSSAKIRAIDAVSLPGALIAGLVYPEGVHTGHGAPGFALLAMAANLTVYVAFWFACCWLVRVLRRRA
jgi:hypothetical protein